MIKCFLETESLELAPGATSQIRLTVINRSPIIDYFAVSLQPRPTNISNPISANARELDPTWLNITPANFSLRPPIPGREDADPPDADSSQIITIGVRVPPDVAAGQYMTQVVISANSGPDNSAILPFSIIVSEVEEQTLTLVPSERVSRRSTEVFQIALHNQGNRPRLYSLYAEDDNYGCRYAVIPPEVTLNPGERTNLSLKVNPRWRNWMSTERIYNFEVKIDNFEEQATGRFVQRCALPPLFFMRRHLAWFIIAFGVLFTILGVLIFLVLPGLFTQINSDCGPQSLRKVEIYSNNITTDIYASDRNGQGPMRKVASKYVTDLPGLFANMVAVSPNGLRLAYVTASDESLDNAQVWMIDLENPNKQPVLLTRIEAGLWPTTPIWTSDGQALSLVVRSKTALNFTKGTPTAGTAVQATAPVGITSTLAASSSTVSATVPEGSTKGLAAFEVWTIKVSDTASASGGALQTAQVPAELNMQLKMFYGDDPYTARPICWNRYDTAILLRPKADQYNPTGKVYGLKPDGGIVAIQLPAAAQELSKLVTQIGPTKGPRATATAVATAIAGSGGGGSSTLAGACAVKNIFSQNDPQWAYLTMDKDKRFKLGDYGCAVVAAATLLNYYGADSDPKTLLQCIDTDASPLTQVGWYSIASTKCGSNKMTGGTRGDFSWENLDRSLQNGPTIVGLLGGQTGTHWLVVNSSGQGLADGYHVSDPWDGSTYKTLNYFISLGYHPRWIINYKGDALGCGIQDTNLAASQVVVGGVRDGVAYQVPQSLRYNVDGANIVSGTLKLLDPKDQTISNKEVVVKPDSPFSVQTQGDYRLLVTAKDPGGDKDIIRNIWFSIDRQAPILTYTTNVQPNRNGHYSAPLSVTLLAYDPWSGVASLQYQIIKRPRVNVNNNNPPSVGNPSALNGFELANQTGNWITYNSDTTSRPLGITDGGTYQVLYRAVDGAGNMNNPFGIIQFEVDGPGGVDTGNNAPIIQPSPTPAATTSPTPAAPVIIAPTPRPPTPRPSTAANNGNNGGSSANRRNKLYEDVTATPLGNVPTPSPTGGVSLLPTPIITTTPGTPSTTPTATVTPTPNPLPLLDVSSTQFTFNPDNTSPQSLVITNKGGSALTWSLTLNDASVSLLNFGQVGGVLAPGASTTINLSVINPTLIFSKQNVTFKVASDGGNKDISVTINPEPLPQATIVSPAVGPLDAQAPVKLNVVANGSLIQADHAIITATYQVCSGGNCQKTSQTILTLNSPWSGTWDNSSLTAQTGISLKGSLCISTDDSICSAIPQVDGYSIPTLAYFVAPTTGSTLTDVTSVVVSHTNRVTGVDLYWNYQNDPNSVPNKFGTVGNFNNWQYAWNTTIFTPTVPVQLSGVAYFDGASGTVTQSLPSVTDLKTAMTASVVFNQDLNTYKALPDVLTATVTSPSQNIDHIYVLATWKRTDSNGVVTPTTEAVMTMGKLQGWAGSWNLLDSFYQLKPQTGITIQVVACFDQASTFCQPLVAPYTNLIKNAGPPTKLDVSPSYVKVFTSSPITQTFLITVTDADKNGVNGAYVTLEAPATGPSLIFANGSYTTTFGPADSNGVIAASGFKTNGISSSGLPFQVQVSLATPVVATPPSPVYINVYSVSTTSPYFEAQPPSQAAKINSNMSPFTLKALSGNGTLFNGTVAVTYSISSGGSGTPSAIFTTIPTGGGCISPTVCTASITNGTATLPQIHTNSVAGDYNILVSGYDTQGGAYFEPLFIKLTNLPGDPFQMQLAAGDGQTAAATKNFASALSVLVQDAYGNAVPNATVNFQVIPSGATEANFGGSASATAQSAPFSSAQGAPPVGVATSPTLTAGSKVRTFSVIASLSGVVGSQPFTFTENTIAGPAAQIIIAPVNSGDLQDADINSAFTNPIRVQVQDAYGNVVNNNATVSFSINAGSNGASGTFSGTSTTLSNVQVDSTGIVTANGLTANAVEGSFKVVAVLDNPGTNSNVAFTENNLGPFLVTIQGGNNQSTQINKAFLTSLQVRVTDKNSKPMVGVPITFTINPNATSGASGTFPGNATFVTVNTGAGGFATVTPPTANQYGGSFSVTAQTANGKNATFTLTNLGVETISVVSGDNQHLYKNQTGSTLTAHVVDINNQPLAGVVVTFQTNPATDPQYVPIPQGNFGGQPSLTATTNAAGDATTASPLSAGPNGGIWSVTASANKDLTTTRTVNFTEITVGDPKTMTCVSGDNQTAYAGQNFGAPLIIRVVDRYGNGRAGVPINVVSNATNGTPAVTLGGSTNTDNNGYITVTMQANTGNNNAGTFSVTGTANGGINPNPSCTFNTETILGAPKTVTANPSTQGPVVSGSNFSALTITVKDNAGQLLSGANVTVTISTPPTGTGPNFAGSVTYSGVTNASGQLVTPVITAGTNPGSYSVSVSASNQGGARNFNNVAQLLET